MGIPVKEIMSTGKTVAKATGKVAYENRDVIAEGAKLGIDAKKKKNQDKDAKTKFQDYLAWRQSGEDIEEFAYSRSEVTGRPWAEIVENINFHLNRAKAKGAPTQMTMQQKREIVASPVLDFLEATQPPIPAKQIEQKASAGQVQGKPTNGGKTDIRKYLKYADVQEKLGMNVTSHEDIPHDLLREFAEVVGQGGDDYMATVKRELLKIAESESATVRDFPSIMVNSFNEAVSCLLIPNFMEPQDVIEALCKLDTRGEYMVIRDKAHRALMIAYNSLN